VEITGIDPSSEGSSTNALGTNCAYALADCGLQVGRLQEEHAPIKFCAGPDSPCSAELMVLPSGGEVQAPVELPEDGPSIRACDSAMVAAYDIW